MRWWQIRRRDEDLERELRADLELEEEEQRERGVPVEEAPYAAKRAFGNMALIKEQTHEAWGWAPIERFWEDLRYAVRSLRRPPLLSIVAILCGVALAGPAMWAFTHFQHGSPLPLRELGTFVLGVSALLLAVVALAATWLPALRATRTDPIQTLRAE